MRSFDSLSDLEIHLEAGTHQISEVLHKESLYDGIRRRWASQFSSISNAVIKHRPELLLFGDATESEQGWALSKPSTSNRFPQEVRSYLEKRFLLGERT